MKPSVEQIGSLLALRREVRPEEGYWQDFLGEFHHRQRQEAVKSHGLKGSLRGFSNWLSDMGPAKWAYGAGIAYACLTAAFLLMPKGPEMEGLPAAPVKHEVLPDKPLPPVQQLEELDLRPSAQGKTGEQSF